jgi:signal transduction histidine kinase
LIGAEVRIRGTAAEAHNRSLRQLIAVEVYIPRAEDLTILKTESLDPFARAVLPLNQLAQYRPGNSLAQRVHIRGVCTLHNPDEVLFVQDSLYGLQIQTRNPPAVSQGDVIEAVGFLNFENYHPILQDAIVRKTTNTPSPINYRPAAIEEIQSGYFHASPVTLTGKLTECTVRPGLEGDSKTATTTLVLQSSNYYFSAIASGLPDQVMLSAIPLGSVLETKGVCVTEIDKDGKLEGFQILLARPQDVFILERPSWFTPEHLMICMAGGGVALIVIAIWLIMVARRNSILHLLVREREKAQLALQEANDQLEQRVKERTNQLKFQITARKEAEVQFKAVLSERTRLAQELHDTVEQTLTGISFQMDVAAKQHEGNPTNSLHHLELARSLMAKSKEEVRQSIWDLRSRALEQFDLSNALAEAARQTTAGSNITVHFESKGRVRPLPEIIEENLLRIGQEAITNVMKHSRATILDITLTFDPKQVVLRIKDNGAGFDQSQAAGPQQGHFGLLGMSERAKRLGGRLLIESPAGQGTLLQANIPLDQPPKVSATIIEQPDVS